MSTLTSPPRPATSDRPSVDGLGEGMARSAATGRRGEDFRVDVQGLRAVAVVLVVLYHCGLAVVPGGFVGVDVFFVISGFLITSHLVREVETDGRVRLLAFWARRARRLLPPALLVVVSTVVVARLWGPALDAARTAQDGLFSAVYAMNYRLALEGVDYQQATAAPSPLQHFWSLAVEEQFYLVWPVLVALVAVATRRWPARARRLALAAAVLVVVALSLHASITTTAVNAPLAYYSLQTRGWELGVGALVALAAPLAARLPGSLAAPLSWAGLGAVVGSAVLFDDATPFPGHAALLPVLGAALLIGGGCARTRRGASLALRHRPTQLVGDLSYSWYLWHWPFLVLAPALFGHSFGLADDLAMAALSLWVALLTHLVVERPTLRPRLVVHRWLAVGAAASLLTASLAVVVAHWSPQVQGSGASVAQASASDLRDLRGQLRAALASDEVPRNLQPSLLTAEEDTPPTSREGCHVELLSTVQPTCVYGDTTADRTVLLLGDSHAEQWLGGLDLWAEGAGYRLVSWTKVACPLADTPIENEQLGREYTECATWREERLQALGALDPDLVVASQADSIVPVGFSDEAWAQGTARTLREVAAVTPRVVFLSDIPRSSVDVPSCLARNLDDVHACDLTSNAALGRSTGDYRHLAGRAAAVRAGLELVDLAYVETQDWLCLDDVCPPVVGSTLVYRDEAHLTQFYVRSIAPVLASAIDAALADNTTRGTTP